MKSATWKAPAIVSVWAAAAFLAAPCVQAVSLTFTWKGGAGNWTDANWAPSGTAGASGTTTNTNTALFNSASAGAIAVDANRNLQSLFFDTSAGSYTFSDGPLVLTNSGAISLLSTVTGVNVIETFNTPITLAGTGTFSNARANAGSALGFAGNITNLATSTLTLSGAGTGTGNFISGNISNGVGVQSVTVNATNATWTLSGANTYGGLTTLAGGTLVLAGSNNSGGATKLTGGTLQLNNAANGGLATGTLTWSGGTLQSLLPAQTLSN